MLSSWVANPAIFVLKVFSCSFTAGVESWSASDDAISSPAEVMADSRTYLHIYFMGIVFNLVYNMGASVLRAMGDSRRPLYVLIVACILNIILDIVLVVAIGMGVRGVAIATVSCQGVSAVLVTGMLMECRQTI